MVFFALAWAIFDARTRNEAPATPARGMLFRRVTGFGRFGPRRAWKGALIWKDFHFISGGKMLLLVKLIFYGVLPIILTIAFNTPRGARVDVEDFGTLILSIAITGGLIEIPLYASRIFREETKWKTLSSITLLPLYTHEIAYSKIAGCIPALLPAVAYLSLGCLLAPSTVGDFMSEVLDEVGFWYAAVQYVLFVHLVAFLSLFIKWGALPLAFALIYLVNGFCLSLMFLAIRGTGPSDGIFVVLAFLGMIATAVVHLGTGVRLRELAAK